MAESARESSRSERRLELLATVLLALATLGTAWAAYESRQWTGQQSQGYSRATANRITVNRESAFLQWVDARANGNTRLAEFYRARFRDEFAPAFSAWLATRPLTNPKAPETPFAMPQYRLAATAEADRLEANAAIESNRAKDANDRATNYMLAVVLFASALFFAGLSTKVASQSTRTLVLALGCVLFVSTVVFLVTLPIRLTN
jgi:hypothetical protein